MRFARLLVKSAFTRVLLGASLLALSPAVSWGQSFTTQHNFDPAGNGGNLGFTPGGGTYFLGNSTDNLNNNTTPAGAPLYVSGTQSYGVYNNAGNSIPAVNLDFANVQLTGAATLNIRLAAFSTGNNAGFDSNGSVSVSISPNDGTPNSYSQVLRIQGSGNGDGVNWAFAANASSLPARGSYGVTPTPNNGLYTATTNITTHYTQLQIALPANMTQAKVRITLTASGKTALLIDDVVITSSSPLPVELTRFTAEAQDKGVALHWITASEKNSDYFEVQRSTNGELFSAIGKIKGEGTTSSVSTYLFTDRAPVAGVAYYRLRQVDFDGTESYSPINSVQWNSKAASFYPNPSKAAITLTGVSGPVHYHVYSLQGQQLAVGEAEGGSTVDLSKVPAGVYMLELLNGGKRNVQRFVRQ